MFEIKRIWLNRDKKLLNEWSELLMSNNLMVDTQVDYTIGIFDKDQLIGTASLYQNIIKCVSISNQYQGNDLLAKLITYLLDYLKEQTVFHVFLYTKPESAILFESLGFKQIIETEHVVFMELGYPDFKDYLTSINEKKVNTKQASGIVMNANPFTLGHFYLIEKAASENEWVYVFVVSEDRSEFSTEERTTLVKKGCASLSNVTVLPTEQYQVSSATFPSYFLKEQAELDISAVQARLDAKLFKQYIAKNLGITKRYVGNEPYSEVTNIYNGAMQEEFGDELELIILDRKQIDSEIISATKVRQAYGQRDFEKLKKMVPETTYNYLKTRGE